MKETRISPVHPGEVLLEDFLKPLGISQYRLAKEMNVYPRKINEIVHGDRSVTADTAIRLSRYFGTSAELWMNLQALYDLEKARDEIEEQVAKEISPLAQENLNEALA
jgi:addiction module HigA family antidote